MNGTSMPKVRVVSFVKEALIALNLPRKLLVEVYANFHSTLPGASGELRRHRVPGQPACFWYHLVLNQDDGFLHLRFRVGDVGWPDELWVVEVERMA
jgi:hypothetical protein